MECSSCGAKVDEEAKYCSECGKAIGGEGVAETAAKEMHYDFKLLYYTWPFFIFEILTLPALAQISSTTDYPFELGFIALIALGLLINWIIYVKFLK